MAGASLRQLKGTFITEVRSVQDDNQCSKKKVEASKVLKLLPLIELVCPNSHYDQNDCCKSTSADEDRRLKLHWHQHGGCSEMLIFTLSGQKTLNN